MENQLIFSESFTKFLFKISDESKIARFILASRRARSDGFHYLYNAALRMDEINYITYRNNGLISFMPADRKQEYNDDGTWKRDGRQEGRPAKVMRNIFTKNALKCLKDSDFEIFNNKYKSQYSDGSYVFEVLPADKIVDVYCMDRMSGGASLNSSCMNGDAEYLEIYSQCKSLEIIVLKNKQGKLAGRALLWTLDFEGETIKLADRFYVAEDHLYDTFVNYVEENKWWRKKYYKTYDNKQDFITPDKKEVRTTFIVHTDTDFDYYPYIDTFSYGDDGYLTNSDSETYTYNQTGGGREGGGAWDEINNVRIDPDYAITIERGRYRNQVTHVDNTVTVGDTVYHIEDEDIRCIDGEWYHVDDVVYSDYDGEDYLLEDCVYSKHHGSYIRTIDAYKVAGDYYHEDVVEKL